MSEQQGIQRLFGGCGCGCGFGNGELIILLILGALLLFGEEIFEFIACNDFGLVWIILLIVLVMGFEW